MFRRLNVGMCLMAMIAMTVVLRASPTAEELDQAARKLGDERFTVREEASKFLLAAGSAAEPVLRKAAAGDDPEARVRAQSILHKFSHGIFPATPPEVAELAGRYDEGDDQEKMQVIEALAATGGYGYLVLTHLAADEHNASMKVKIDDAFLTMPSETVADTARLVIVTSGVAGAEHLLAVAANRGPVAPMRAYAAFLLNQGGIDAKITELQNQLAGDEAGPFTARLLVVFYRAAGLLDQAAALAEQSKDSATAIDLALERQDWKKLAELLEANDEDHIRPLGLLAAAQRLAGDSDACAKSLARAAALARANRDDYWPMAAALLLNDRLPDAIDLFIEHKNYLSAFDFLVDSYRYADALALLDRARNEASSDVAKLTAMAARVHWRLGETDKAAALLDSLALENDQKKDFGVYALLGGVEWEIGRTEPGMREKARQHALAALSVAGTNDGLSSLFEEIFPGSGAVAAQWWELLRRSFPEQAPPDALDRLARVINHQMTADETSDFCHRIAAMPDEEFGRVPSVPLRGPAPPAISREQRWTLLADALVAVGRRDSAEVYFNQLDRVREARGYFADIADRAAEKKDWAAAVKWYEREQAASRYQTTARIWAHGWALSQAGKDREGKELMDLARLLPLGDERGIGELAEVMDARGREEEAHAQRVLLTRVGMPGRKEYSDARKQLGIDASRRGDDFAGADGWQSLLLHLLNYGQRFINQHDDVEIPQRVHRFRARALYRAGRLDEAMTEFTSLLTTTPCYLPNVIDAVPELKSLGHAAEARTLFDMIYRNLDGLCTQYPQSASFHNQVAWLCVKCGYEPEQAMIHAKKGVQLSPRDTNVIDTLAEVYFQAGDRDRAVELMKQCQALEPGQPRHAARREEFEQRT